jgi:hypothetical protein
VTAAGGGVAPERVQPAAAPDRELLVACLNLENLSPSSDAAKLAGLGRVIATTSRPRTSSRWRRCRTTAGR